ncbi:MAG TPA: TldD/PmbA family protein [Chloroflexota bacterium]|nr:TldD/PmbA family protein [Chloroflexota bacterium]
MEGYVQRALNTAAVRGAGYAEARLVDLMVESLVVKDGQIDAVLHRESMGIGVRVLADGAWGFAGSARLTADGVDQAAATAVAIAKAGASVPGPRVDLGPAVTHQASYRTPIERDPFAVPLEEKIALLMEADRGMRAVRGVTTARGEIVWQRERKYFGNSEGAAIEQEIFETGCGIEATAVGNGEVQNRSYPNSFRHQTTRGYEFVTACDLPGHAHRIGAEAVALLTAKQCPQAISTTLILDSSQLALQIHESCGHPIELDRVYGTELDFAGGSFLTLDQLGSLRYGSPLVNIYADATIPGALGSFGYDDEGVPAQRTPIVKDGMLVGYLTSREFAQRLGIPNMGAARADGWNRIPLIRMTNISIEPGDWRFDDLIADTDTGIYMETNRSWSIDDQRLNFQFGTQVAYEVNGGKLGALLKNATYTGITPQFWRSMDAICNRDAYTVWGTPNCGKGVPQQIAHTGHGAAPARFRNVRIGVVR